MKKFLVLVLVFQICSAGENLDTNLSSQTALGDTNATLTDINLSANSSTIDSANSSSNLGASIKGDEFSVYSLYKNADLIVKIVICILIFFSIISWSVFIAKIWQFALYNKNLKRELQRLKEIKFLNELKSLKKTSFTNEISAEILDEIHKSNALSNTQKRILSRIETKISTILNESKNLTAILASIGSSAPFIGLFGTVWGIMNAFIGIANSNDTGLDVVAPGIAEALFATAFGLAAAIPAVLFYNYILRKTTKFANLLDELATMLFVIADRTLNSSQNLTNIGRENA